MIQRLLMIGFFIVGGLFFPARPVPWAVIPITFVFGFIAGAVLVRHAIQRSDHPHTPSWRVSPFLRSEPLQFLHAAAFCAMGLGVSASLRTIWIGTDGVPSTIFYFTFGLGLWIAVTLVSRWVQAKRT